MELDLELILEGYCTGKGDFATLPIQYARKVGIVFSRGRGSIGVLISNYNDDCSFRRSH